MKVGDLVLFYHSNTKTPHVAGVARITVKGTVISHLGTLPASTLTKNQRQKTHAGSWLTSNRFVS